MQQPQQPRYFRVFFPVRLRSSHFTFRACVLNISNDNNVYHADLYSGSVNLHLTSLNDSEWEREIDWSCAITCVCPSGKVMYICENRLSYPRKAKSVLASTHCWSAEPLKVALKVKMISTALYYIPLWMNQPFERAVEWTVKDSLKDSLLPPPCGETMKLDWLTARLEHAGQISTEKVSCAVRFKDYN